MPALSPRRRGAALLFAIVTAMATAMAGCGGPSDAGDRPRVAVFAAASLAEAFTTLAGEFEEAQADWSVALNLAGSAQLAGQITAGAPADVLATADPLAMEPLIDGGVVRSPAVLARNRLALVVAEGNPLGIDSLEDLTRPDVVVVVCAPEVPCGRYARAALDAAAVELRPASLADNVKAALSRVVLGEADAAIVYRTDARTASAQVDAVDIAGLGSIEVVVPIAVLDDAVHPAGARAWVAFATGPRGRAVLRRHGFLVS